VTLPVYHPYVRFRIRLARHALAQFAASVLSSAEILLLLFAPMLLGLLAAIALPPMLIATLPLSMALPLLALHGLVMALPVALLRKRVLPLDVVQWLHALPVPSRQALRAELAVAGMLAGPLALAYLASAAICLWQQPQWLDPVPALAGLLLSMLLTWVASAGLLALRVRRPQPKAAWQRRLPTQPAPFAMAPRRPLALLLWQRLFWLPFWRNDNVVGWQQSALLAAAAASVLAWMFGLPLLPPGALAFSSSVLLVMLTDRGDKAVREQVAAVRPLAAGWAAPMPKVLLLARAFALLPGALVLALMIGAGWQRGLLAHTAAQAYLVLALAAQLLLVAIPHFNARARVVLVVGAMLILTALGSEIWN
jgi:hypothetical protein